MPFSISHRRYRCPLQQLVCVLKAQGRRVLCWYPEYNTTRVSCACMGAPLLYSVMNDMHALHTWPQAYLPLRATDQDHKTVLEMLNAELQPEHRTQVLRGPQRGVPSVSCEKP